MWKVAGLAFVGLVVWLSLTPDPIQAPSFDGVKTGHFAAYAWLMFWHAHLFRRPGQRIAVGLAFTLMGVLLEFIQGTTTYRTFGVTDMRDNVFGLLAGFGVFLTPCARILPWIDRRMAQAMT